MPKYICKHAMFYDAAKCHLQQSPTQKRYVDVGPYDARDARRARGPRPWATCNDPREANTSAGGLGATGVLECTAELYGVLMATAAAGFRAASNCCGRPGHAEARSSP
mmetsp:Transcript_13529/g.28930  ORF Transcript_13529/g.28930 Transcript_13529/m.28930 type:complete len:108 (+) Transcript_13529:368-691(+)